jgi:hypothetical protein
MFFCVMSATKSYASEAASQPNSTVIQEGTAQLSPQAWQIRQANLIKIIKGVEAKDPASIKTFGEVLTNFEKQPVALTPMENMLILGVFYVPKEGAEKALPLIVMNAVLGWYDALRFGSESGRAEIKAQKFFIEPFLFGTSGNTQENAKKYLQSLQSDRQKTAEAIQSGLAFAEKERDISSYDHHWPTAFGLEATVCAQGGSCSPIPELPHDQWDNAWQQAKDQIGAYYQPATK